MRPFLHFGCLNQALLDYVRLVSECDLTKLTCCKFTVAALFSIHYNPVTAVPYMRRRDCCRQVWASMVCAAWHAMTDASVGRISSPSLAGIRCIMLIWQPEQWSERERKWGRNVCKPKEWEEEIRMKWWLQSMVWASHNLHLWDEHCHFPHVSGHHLFLSTHHLSRVRQ